MKAPSPILGTVPCPVADCKHACPVRKFQQLASDDRFRRKAGKFFFDCATHGRFGFDGNAAMQEHVLEHITWSEGQQPNTPKAAASADVSSGNRGTEAAPRSLPAVVKKPGPTAAAKPPPSTSTGKQTGTQTQTKPARKPWISDEDFF